MSLLFPTSTQLNNGRPIPNNDSGSLPGVARKKTTRHQKPKLTVQDVTKTSTINKALEIGRRYAYKASKPEADQLQVLEGLLKRMQTWAAEVSPQYTLGEFTTAAKGLSGNRQLRPMLADIRLAEMRRTAAKDRGITLDTEEGDIDLNIQDAQVQIEQNEMDRVNGGVQAEDPPDMDDVNDAWEELEDEMLMRAEEEHLGNNDKKEQDEKEADKDVNDVDMEIMAEFEAED